jgi:Tfp pilus assembly protein PilN
MINLLPSGVKSEIAYARRNTQLRRWLAACSAALVLLAVIVAGGLLYMQHNINTYTKQVEESKLALQSQKVVETQGRIDEISNNTKLAIQVLSREILFSKLLRQIGAALPQDSALKSLEIDQVKGGLQLNAEAGSFNSATQVQLNLQDPKNKVFDKADINSVQCDEPGPDTPTKRYPCSIVLRALFNDNNSYRYISPPGAKP